VTYHHKPRHERFMLYVAYYGALAFIGSIILDIAQAVSK